MRIYLKGVSIEDTPFLLNYLYVKILYNMNKVITTQGNVQFQFPDGKIVNVHPNHIYTVYNEDTVSFILVALPKSSGLSTMTSKAEDLELNGTVYSFAELPNAVSEAFAIAGAQARCEIVDELPESGYTNTIYLVPQEEGEGYDEYIWLKDEERWELIGNTDIEMKNYLKKVDFNAYSAATKVDIDNEISARTAGDTALDNKIDALSASTDEAISGLTDAIDAEETAREAADGVISGAVDTVSSGLTEEVQRAQNAESGLSDAIAAEEARAIAAENEKTVTISLTQAEYDLLPSSAKTDATKLYVISDAQPIDLSVYAKVSALTEEISARTDADTTLDNKINAVSAATDDALALKLDATAYTPTVVDSALDSGSTNPVENQAIWSETTYNKDVLLTFDIDRCSTNYPEGCTKLKVKVLGSNNSSSIDFLSSDMLIFANIIITNWGSISVDTRDFQGASYEISGRTVIISYPTPIMDVAQINVSAPGSVYEYKAVVEGAWINENTYMKSEVNGIASGLQNNINASFAATDSRLSEDEEVTAAAFNELNEALSGKQNTLSVGRGISISSNTISFDLPISAGTGSDSIVEGYSLNKASGEYSHAEGKTTKASGNSSHAEGKTTTASGDASHAEGYLTSASGNFSHAEGAYSVASGDLSHAEGQGTIASGNYSHAEGNNTIASGNYSHAEGIETYAIGHYSHTEGAGTLATCSYSHAEGHNTATQNEAEHASGRYNNSVSASTTFGDSGNTLFSVGNGTGNDAKHNAFEIRQNGDIYFEYDGNDIKLQDKLDDIESVTAAAINNLNDKFGGLKLQQITQSAYDQLQTKDPNVLYVIVN